jgi:hypothetical protein
MSLIPTKKSLWIIIGLQIAYHKKIYTLNKAYTYLYQENENVYTFYRSLNIIWVIKSKKMK